MVPSAVDLGWFLRSFAWKNRRNPRIAAISLANAADDGAAEAPAGRRLGHPRCRPALRRRPPRRPRPGPRAPPARSLLLRSPPPRARTLRRLIPNGSRLLTLSSLSAGVLDVQVGLREAATAKEDAVTPADPRIAGLPLGPGKIRS